MQTQSQVGRPYPFAMNATIVKLVKENPRRSGTNRYKRFAAYKTGMTVAAARKIKAITVSGLHTDIEEKLIKITTRKA